jgi:DHA2 family multidrug resistance protein
VSDRAAEVEPEPEVPRRAWLAIIGASLGAFMAVLNIQIVGASLGDIRGALGVGSDDGGWISTGYLVAEIVVIPLTGWLSKAFSPRRYLIANAVLFLVFSAACAFAQSLEQMIALRVLQGLAGGVLIPMAFTLIMTLLPPSRQPTGIALFGLTATLAPAVGPLIGGWLTATWGWQYIFLVNLLPGAAMLLLLWHALEPSPMQLPLLRRGDWPGIATMALGLGALQVVLEEGNREDWFESALITQMAVLSAACLVLFVWIELRSAQPLLNLRLFARRNFGIGMLAMLFLGLAVYGSVFVLPAYLARVQGYDAHQIGIVLAWTGLPQLFLIPLVPRLMRSIDARWLVIAGLGLFAASNFMNIELTVDVGGDQLMLPNIVRALGQALVLTPLTALATGGLLAADAGSASALLNIMRNLGGAIGIALLQTFLSDRARFHYVMIGETVSQFDEATRTRLEQLARRFTEQGAADPAAALAQATAAIADMVSRQAYTMAVGDAFHVLAFALTLALGATLLLKKAGAKAAVH